MVKADEQIYPLISEKNAEGGKDKDFLYRAKVTRKVTARPVESLPNGSLIMKVIAGQSAGEEILLITHNGQRYLNFTEGIADTARNLVQAAQEAKEKVPSPA